MRNYPPPLSSRRRCERTNVSKLDDLRKAADGCRASCSDYSCVRRGDCGGHAGHAWRDAQYEAEQERKQNHADAVLVAQIKRLKKAGTL
jgi:hypothetical protein